MSGCANHHQHSGSTRWTKKSGRREQCAIFVGEFRVIFDFLGKRKKGSCGGFALCSCSTSKVCCDGPIIQYSNNEGPRGVHRQDGMVLIGVADRARCPASSSLAPFFFCLSSAWFWKSVKCVRMFFVTGLPPVYFRP